MRSKGKFLGLDIGTTSLKAAVFDEQGHRLAQRSVDYTLSTDPSTGYIEFNPQRYVEMCRTVIDDLELECGGIDAISVDTQGETLIVTDGEGNPLYPAIVWLDNRAEEEAEAIRRRFGNELVYRVTGQPEITAGWPASKLLWFKNCRPEIFGRIERVFMLEDWILFGLTGRFVTEPTIQSSTTYYDIVNGRWWADMLSFIGISEKALPELCPTASVIGDYRGIPVVTGMLDQIAGTIGAGVTDGEKISEMTGTIMAICALADEIPEYRPDSIIPCHVHAIPGKYCRILWSSTAGMALKWFRNNLAEQFDFRELDELAADIAPGSDGLTMLPYFCGSTMPKYNPEARAAFAGINLSHTRGHFARAIMEAIAFTLRQDLEYIGTDAIREIRITGGGAKSPLWASIKADVTGKVLRTVTEDETACLGTALAAAVGIGVFPSIADAAAKAVTTKRSFVPSGADYEAAYRSFCSLDEKLN